MNLPDWLLLMMWRALIGEVYPNVRAIAIALSDTGNLRIRYYLDRRPTDFDWESIEVVATNFSSQIGTEKIFHTELECVFSESPIGTLDSLGGIVYSRREYDMSA